jgi:hypothetical protein
LTIRDENFDDLFRWNQLINLRPIPESLAVEADWIGGSVSRAAINPGAAYAR